MACVSDYNELPVGVWGIAIYRAISQIVIGFVPSIYPVSKILRCERCDVTSFSLRGNLVLWRRDFLVIVMSDVVCGEHIP